MKTNDEEIIERVLKEINADTLRGADLREAKGEFIFNWGVKLKVVQEKGEGWGK